MHHSESVVARLRRLASRTLTRAGTLALWAGSPANRPLRTCQALKRLNPEAEAGCPDKSRATCRTALLSGLVVAAVAFINVAIAALHTFTEVRNESHGPNSGPLWWWVWFCWLPLSGCSASLPTFCCRSLRRCRPFVLPDRLNSEPVVFRGFTTHEMGLAARGAGAGLLLSLPFIPLAGWVVVPTGLLVMPLLLVWFGGRWMAGSSAVSLRTGSGSDWRRKTPAGDGQSETDSGCPGLVSET